jgi:pimeloyl-ACP methyl ester carboxylesterase
MNQTMDSFAAAMIPPVTELARLDARFPCRTIHVNDGAVVAVRECGEGPAIVCLHGIGSGSASWLDVASRLAPRARVIAWDAPGYGSSTPLAEPSPKAAHYAARLNELLAALGVSRCVLVGHSLGALTAAAAAQNNASGAERIAQLTLISPARGYGLRPEQSRGVRTERLATLTALGIAGMASQRSSRLVSDNATDLARQWVRWNMARLHEGGYRQAIELLCGEDLLNLLPPVCPVRVLCGDADVVTPPSACEDIARACGVALESISGAGHACYVEQPEAIAKALQDAALHLSPSNLSQ